MHRFWIFPLVLGVAGATFPVLSLEGFTPLIPMLLGPGVSIEPSPAEIGDFILKAMLCGFVVGCVLGLIAAVFDAVRNGRISRSARHLAANIAWCLLYAHGPIAVNLVILFLWMQNTSDFSIVSWGCWLPSLLCLVAIAWGTIRSITNTDVLSPRVLASKLKRSTHVQG